MSRRGESIYKRKDGRWEARFIHHYENGEAKYRSVYAHSYTEAKAKRFEEISQPECSHVTRVKYIAKFGEISMLWLRDIRSCVKESTYSRYYRIVEHYINPTFADIMLIKLDQQYIKSFSVRLKTSGGMNGTSLSDKTVSDILCVLKSIFRYGNDNGYPCEILTKMKMSAFSKSEPKIITNTKREMIETEIFESESICNDCRIKIGILLTLYTGIRIGELCGLRNSDIDLNENTVSIKRTVQRISDLSLHTTSKTKVIIDKPKTVSSIRTIPIPSFLANILTVYVSNPEFYLLTGTEEFYEPHRFYMRYKTFMKRLGLEEYTFHSLRHTFATRCIDNGFDAKSLSEILGHSNVSTTLSLYVHPTLEQKRKQMEKLKP